MNVEINGEARDVCGPTLVHLLDELGIGGKIATAVNETFIARTARVGCVLKDGDRIEIVAPKQGG